MIDIVFPKPGTETAFVRMAERLGLTGLVLCYPMPDSKSYQDAKKLLEIESSIALHLAQLVTEKTRKLFPITKILVGPSNPRSAFENSKADIICNLELHDRKDFLHHRASGLNQIIATIGAKRGKSLGMLFSQLFSEDTPLLIGRMRQNVVLARKSKLPCLVISGARDPYEMRAERELASFCTLIGSHAKPGAKV